LDERFGIYRLGFPNREVEEGFVRFLLPYYANVNKVESPFEIQKFVREVESGDYDSFFRRLQSFFADTTYEVIRDRNCITRMYFSSSLNWLASMPKWNIIQAKGASILSCRQTISSISWNLN